MASDPQTQNVGETGNIWSIQKKSKETGLKRLNGRSIELKTAIAKLLTTLLLL